MQRCLKGQRGREEKIFDSCLHSWLFFKKVVNQAKGWGSAVS